MVPVNGFNKLCDAADWFDPVVGEIIRTELHETPRFHRKQWEFALIFRSLRRLGVVHPRSRGLSLGSGRERLLFTLIAHIEQLVATDLYNPETVWETARAMDPEQFVKAEPPFEAPLERLAVRHMDMREIDFPDRSFDFCYSACAVEHIGGYQDFLTHLNEVYRVLKPGGYYVLTTEFHYGEETIEDPNNYVFGFPYLNRLIEESPLAPTGPLDARLASHSANFPLPGNLQHVLGADAGRLTGCLIEEVPHIQLMKGKQPFTSVMITLQKRERPAFGTGWAQVHLEQSREWIRLGVERYRRWVERSRIAPDPFAALPGGRPGSYFSHEPFTTNQPVTEDGTVFHTDYIWLGSGRRPVQVAFEVRGCQEPTLLEVRIHSLEPLRPQRVQEVAVRQVQGLKPGRVQQELILEASDACCYAVLAKCRQGKVSLAGVDVQVLPSGEA
ncbi:MAG: class I SAM-dependent methyltransferase [Calditrichaeota bacterium]|nr:MAG: class I SAM-dependent methyltransferase [Calditrichota bacterium]